MTELPDDLFQQLSRRAPTQADKDRLMGVKASLGLSARDELWPVIMTLDHYASANQSARSTMIKEMNLAIEAIKSIPESAGPIAAAEAQKAVALAVDAAADKIAKVAVQKSETRADQISKRKLIVAAIAGCAVAATIAATSAYAMYFVLDAKGICAETAVLQDAVKFCVVDRNPG